MIVYIAGPLSLHGAATPHEIEVNKEAFYAAERRLEDLGHTPVSPLTVEPRTDIPWQQAMKSCLAALIQCEAVLLLPGWEDSAGARLEARTAEALGIPLYYAERADELVAAGVEWWGASDDPATPSP